MRVFICPMCIANAASTVAALEEHGHTAAVFLSWRKMLEAAERGLCDVMILELQAVLDDGSPDSYEKFAEAKMASNSLQAIPLILIGAPADRPLHRMVGWSGFLYAYLRYPMDPDSILRVLAQIRQSSTHTA